MALVRALAYTCTWWPNNTPFSNKHTNVNGSRESTNRWPAMMVIPFWQPTIV